MTFDPLRREVRLRTERAVRKAANDLRRDLATHGPRKTGRLVRESRVQVRGVTMDIEIGVPYAEYVRRGTKPHLIRGRPLLAFFWEKIGRNMVLPFVRHPGTKPNPWYDRAVGRITDNVRRYLR